MDKSIEFCKTKSKEILAKRIFFAIGSSIIVHFFLMSAVLLLTNLKVTKPLEWLQNTWHVVTCVKMWIYFFIFSVVVFLKGVVSSKDYLNPPVYIKSRFVKLCYFFNLHSLIVANLHILLGGILSWLHLSVEGGRYSSLIKQCADFQSYCLVEENYFLLLEGCWFGLYYFTRLSNFGSENLEFQIIPISKFSQIQRGIKSSIAKALFDAIWPTIYFIVFYSTFGGYCRNIISIPFSILIEEEPLEKFSRLFNFYIILYAWLHGVLFILINKSMHTFFQAYLTEWLSFNIENTSIQSDKLQITLSEVLTMDKVPILQQLGYLDLVNISQKDKFRRSFFFTLSQPGGHPYNWNNVLEKSLLLIKKFTENLNLALTNKIEHLTLTAKNQTAESQVVDKPYTYHMRSLVSRNEVISPPRMDFKVTEPKPVENYFTQCYKNIKKNLTNYLLSKPLISYLFGEQFECKIRYIFNDAQAVIWAMDSISALAVASLKEDPYGVVQKDLTKIIETLLKLKLSLEKLQKLNISIRKPVSDDKLLRQTLNALRSAVKRSIYRIICQFKKYIDELDLPSSTVDQLQPFFSYKE